MFKFFVVAANAADDEFVVHRSPKALEAGTVANALGAPERTVAPSGSPRPSP